MPFQFSGIDQHEAAVVEILALAFATDPREVPSWIGRAGREEVRVLSEEGRAIATLVRVMMGQFFGGRSVPCAGIAGVGVLPERRGQGAGRALLERALVELHEAKVAVSTLYPATQELYRTIGYELAGSRVTYHQKLSEVALGKREVMARAEDEATLRRADEQADRDAIRAVYTEAARRGAGALDRGRYIWARVERPQGQTTQAYLVESSRGVEGYVRLLQRREPTIHTSLPTIDLAAISARAHRRILSLLLAYRSVAESLTFYDAPQSPWLLPLAEHHLLVRDEIRWMLRVVHVEAALEARGYPAGLTGALELQIDDPLLPANAGRFVVELGDGRAKVTRGGRGLLRFDVGALGALFTGFASARALAALGRAEGEEASIQLADAAFAGPPPGMADMF